MHFHYNYYKVIKKCYELILTNSCPFVKFSRLTHFLTVLLCNNPAKAHSKIPANKFYAYTKICL